MIELGTTSVYSSYTSASSLYNSNQVSYVKGKEESTDQDTLPHISTNDDIEDEAIISDEAKALAESDSNSNSIDQAKDKMEPEIQGAKEPEDGTPKSEKELTQEEQDQISKLKARDAEVRAHEQAHIAAASGINASAPSYDYEEGPDGQKYAVGGEVNLSYTSGGDPEADLRNAQTLKAAALAPAQPSGQDLSVAQNADKMMAEAKERIASEKEQAKTQDDSETTSIPANTADKITENNNINNETETNTKIQPNNEVSSSKLLISGIG